MAVQGFQLGQRGAPVVPDNAWYPAQAKYLIETVVVWVDDIITTNTVASSITRICALCKKMRAAMISRLFVLS